MKAIVTIQHPAHVHFFKHPITELVTKGHSVYVFYREGQLIEELLNAYDIEATKLVSPADGTISTVATQLKYEYSLYQNAYQIQPDLITAVGGIAATHVAKAVGATSVVFTDSGDHAPLNRIGTKFADVVCTPSCLSTSYGDKQIHYDGYHELAYLHPNWFEPDRSSLSELDVDVNEPYSLVRFISWKAQHDIGQSGFSMEKQRELVDELDQFGEVYITMEGELPSEFESYQLPVPPEQIHQLLSFANLYIGDSQTMATEAAILGTPSIRSNSFAGEDDMDNFIELEQKYGLLYSTPESEEAISKAIELGNQTNIKEKWEQKREQLLLEKIDVTPYVVELLQREGQK